MKIPKNAIKVWGVFLEDRSSPEIPIYSIVQHGDKRLFFGADTSHFSSTGKLKIYIPLPTLD